MQNFKVTCSKNERPMREAEEKKLNVAVDLTKNTPNIMDINMCVDLRSVGSTVKIESAGAINMDVSISIRYFFINICSLK